MKLKKLLIIPILSLLLLFSIVFNYTYLYAAEGVTLDFTVSSDATPLYDELGQLSGVSWINDPETDFRSSRMHVITIDNILNEPINLDSSRIFTNSSSKLFYPRNIIPSSLPYVIVAEIDSNQTEYTIKFVNDYGFSALNDDVSVEDFNSTNISIRTYLGETDDLYTYAFKRFSSLVNLTSISEGSGSLAESLSSAGIYDNDDLSTFPLDTYGEFFEEMDIITAEGRVFSVLTYNYENIFYNQTAGPTSIEEANAGDQIILTSSWIDPLLDSFSPEPYTRTLTLYETFNGVNPGIRIGNKVYPLALSLDDMIFTISDPLFNPQTDIFIGDGKYWATPQNYSFSSFSITKDGEDASDYYLSSNGTYNVSSTFTGDDDSNTYTFDFELTTDMPIDLIIASNASGYEVANESEINISEDIIVSDQLSYEAIMSSLDEYLTFTHEDNSIIIPGKTFTVYDADDVDVSNTLWKNQPGIYSIEYVYTFDGFVAPDFKTIFVVEVYENQPPIVSGPEVYSIAVDRDDFSEDYLINLFQVSDDLDVSDDLNISVASDTFDFETSILEIGSHDFFVTVEDTDGLVSTSEITINIYEPLVSSNIFNISMSITSSLILLLAGVYIFKKIKK